ncbi:3-ketoacyl-CoA thiolase, mitochondrial-like [Ostrinia nubilalis]|uniref:3-ketoacyl-CoA thiolase, mitochondrial-like n=1 Tax=Ostrinia nubilalis TaxID=29057 RepID=UPI003082242E
MALTTKGIFVIGAKRTPFCSFGGPLRDTPAGLAFAATAKDAIQMSKLDSTLIDNTVIGNAHYLSQCDGGKTARYCSLYSGVPIDRPALAVNKACGSGLQAVITGAQDILTGMARVSLTGGTEIMSALPFLVKNVRFGSSLGSNYTFEDHIQKQFLDSYSGLTLQRMAEDLAKKYGIKRQEVDEFAFNSHMKWKAAQESKLFDSELTSINVTLKKKEVVVDKDELPQQKISLEGLSLLPTIIDNASVITTGNSSGPADGAAAVLIADEGTVKQKQLKPLARVTGWACLGSDPLEPGLGAVPAVERLLAVAGLTVNNIDLFEINETFASQVLASAMVLNIDPAKINVSGGAVALGNPVGATAARMVVHLVHELRRRNLKRGIVASSCGGGQGIAVLFEAL